MESNTIFFRLFSSDHVAITINAFQTLFNKKEFSNSNDDQSMLLK